MYKKQEDELKRIAADSALLVEKTIKNLMPNLNKLISDTEKYKTIAKNMAYYEKSLVNKLDFSSIIESYNKQMYIESVFNRKPPRDPYAFYNVNSYQSINAQYNVYIDGMLVGTMTTRPYLSIEGGDVIEYSGDDDE